MVPRFFVGATLTVQSNVLIIIVQHTITVKWGAFTIIPRKSYAHSRDAPYATSDIELSKACIVMPASGIVNISSAVCAG